MTAVLEYVRRLILVLFMVQVAKLLAPGGELRPYIRFVCGLLVVAAVIQPLGAVATGVGDSFADITLPAVQVDADEVPAWAQQGQQKSEDISEEIYLHRVGEFITAEVNGLPAVKERGLTAKVLPQSDGQGKMSAELESVVVYLFGESVEDSRETEGQHDQDSGISVVIDTISTINISDDDLITSLDEDEEKAVRKVDREVREQILRHFQDKYRMEAEKIHIIKEEEG